MSIPLSKSRQRACTEIVVISFLRLFVIFIPLFLLRDEYRQFPHVVVYPMEREIEKMKRGNKEYSKKRRRKRIEKRKR